MMAFLKAKFCHKSVNIHNDPAKSLACQYFGLKMLSAFTSAVYNIQVHFRLDFIMEANTLNPDQTAP